MNVFLKNLAMIIDEKKIVSLYTDIYNETFNGYIVCISDDLLLLNSFEISRPNGIKIFRIDDITRIRWDSKELEEIESLIISQKNFKDKTYLDIENKKRAIESVQNLFGHVTLYVQSLDKNICFIGEVVEMDDETLIIHEYGAFGSNERSYMLVALQDITRIDANGIYEKQIIELATQSCRSVNKLE